MLCGIWSLSVDLSEARLPTVQSQSQGLGLNLIYSSMYVARQLNCDISFRRVIHWICNRQKNKSECPTPAPSPAEGAGRSGLLFPSVDEGTDVVRLWLFSSVRLQIQFSTLKTTSLDLLRSLEKTNAAEVGS